MVSTEFIYNFGTIVKLKNCRLSHPKLGTIYIRSFNLDDSHLSDIVHVSCFHTHTHKKIRRGG